jgi:hypothetical protein
MGRSKSTVGLMASPGRTREGVDAVLRVVAGSDGRMDAAPADQTIAADPGDKRRRGRFT